MTVEAEAIDVEVTELRARLPDVQRGAFLICCQGACQSS